MNGRFQRRRSPAESAPTHASGEGEATRICLVEDQPAVIAALVRLLETEPGFTVCGHAATLEGAHKLVGEHNPDVVLLDLGLGAESGFDLLSELRTIWEGPVLMVSVRSENSNTVPALRAGASGYLMKADIAECLIDAVHTILRGEVYLSAAGQRLPGASEMMSARSRWR